MRIHRNDLIASALSVLFLSVFVPFAFWLRHSEPIWTALAAIPPL